MRYQLESDTCFNSSSQDGSIQRVHTYICSRPGCRSHLSFCLLVIAWCPVSSSRKTVRKNSVMGMDVKPVRLSVRPSSCKQDLCCLLSIRFAGLLFHSLTNMWKRNSMSLGPGKKNTPTGEPASPISQCWFPSSTDPPWKCRRNDKNKKQQQLYCESRL